MLFSPPGARSGALGRGTRCPAEHEVPMFTYSMVKPSIVWYGIVWYVLA